MDDEIDRLVVSIRADTTALAADAKAARATIEGPIAQGADVAGRAIESALLKATRTGRLGFEDLKKVALSVLSEIAANAIRGGIAAIGGGGGGAGGLGGLIGTVGTLLGAPGRATGGPVSPGRAYRVGERGPELFVPTTSGQVVAPSATARQGVQVAITIRADAGAQPQALARSSRQVARAVRAAIEGTES